jgi:hypothetical protein
VPDVQLLDDHLTIKVSLIDKLLGFHGVFEIPYAHVMNAFVSSLEELDLQYRLEGANFGLDGSIGVFGSPAGLIMVDASGDRDALVLETRGERFPRIAVQLPARSDPNAVAHAIMQRIPDSGPVD